MAAISIGLIGAGAMGSALGAMFSRAGNHVLSPLTGRSFGTRERAEKAGMQAATYAELVAADIILSVVPPGQAKAVVQQLAAAIVDCTSPPLIIDANALAPDSKLELENVINAAGGRFADGVIIGGPPQKGYDGPRLYVSGANAGDSLVLRNTGLDVRVLDGPTGAAAALKMCYAGFNKGITALTTAILLAARRSGADKALIDEFLISQKPLLERSRSAIPRMYPKAYRWIAEFDEIAEFMSDDLASAQIFAAMARFFEGRSAANESGAELEVLLEILNGADQQDRCGR